MYSKATVKGYASYAYVIEVKGASGANSQFFHEREQAAGAFSPEVSKHWVTISHQGLSRKKRLGACEEDHKQTLFRYKDESAGSAEAEKLRP